MSGISTNLVLFVDGAAGAIWPTGPQPLFVTNMSAGHGGTSGRFGAVDVDARVMAWLITLAQ